MDVKHIKAVISADSITPILAYDQFTHFVGIIALRVYGEGCTRFNVDTVAKGHRHAVFENQIDISLQLNIVVECDVHIRIIPKFITTLPIAQSRQIGFNIFEFIKYFFSICSCIYVEKEIFDNVQSGIVVGIGRN